MTALAMIIGMGPMAMSAEQNAPLGRAVIGGLLCATIATLAVRSGRLPNGARARMIAMRRTTKRPQSGVVPSPA